MFGKATEAAPEETIDLSLSVRKPYQKISKSHIGLTHSAKKRNSDNVRKKVIAVKNASAEIK